MKPIKNPPPPPIGPNTNSDDIVNLQDALLFLFEQGRFRLSDEEYEALQQDRRAQMYCEGTRWAVETFREKLGTNRGEVVDESIWGNSVWATSILTGGERHYYNTVDHTGDALWDIIRSIHEAEELLIRKISLENFLLKKYNEKHHISTPPRR